VKGRCTISFTRRVRNGTPLISRGFHGGRRTDVDAARVPPGQYADKDSPVLSAGPSPSVPFDRWLFTVDGAVGQSRFLAIAPISRRRFVGVLAVREGKPALGGGCRRRDHRSRSARSRTRPRCRWEPRRRTIETVDSAGGQGTAPTSSGVGRLRWACLRPNTKGQ
jgi:hypothetical protein